jgi:hypothetical protein
MRFRSKELMPMITGSSMTPPLPARVVAGASSQAMARGYGRRPLSGG